ncbi:MAG TPA: hypothetical protein VGO04_03530 [Ensifer sp.]|jgi:hypothetical protein|uniref:hypothetical protein n=1 Tax=Ensifer sp. TaxID=1872086 RepID=UPI002E139111|nr:hypothetical protein [Ensifer sp.]
MRRISDFDDFYEAPIGLGGALELRDFGEEATSWASNRDNPERGDIYRQTGRPVSTGLQFQSHPRWDRNRGMRDNRVRGLVDFVSGPDADKNDDGIPDNYQTSDDRALAPSSVYEPFPGRSRREDGIPLFGPGIAGPHSGMPTTSRYLDEQREKLRIRQEELERAHVIDEKTGWPIQRFIDDGLGNNMIEPLGGSTVPGHNPVDTHTLYPNGSNYQRLNPQGHADDPIPHGHGHLEGTGPNTRGQGPSLDVQGNVVPRKSPRAHWPIRK